MFTSASTILGYARLYRKAAYLFGKLQPVHRLYKACIAYYIFYLIGLQLSNQMRVKAVFFEKIQLVPELLRPVFAHMARARGDRLGYAPPYLQIL